MRRSTLFLQRSEVAQLLDLDTCIPAVEDAFRAYSEHRVIPPGVLSTHVDQGAFHIKAAGLQLDRTYYAAKINGNFPRNYLIGLPTIQGVIVLCDAENGYPLAILDSIEITILRTGAATAVAAKYLAAENADQVMIWGCGNQGKVQLRSLAKVRKIKRIIVFDRDPEVAERFSDDLSRELQMEISVTKDPIASTKESLICVTCTTSTKPLIRNGDLPEGIFVAAVGADNPEKQELDPQLFTGNKIVVDILDQCLSIGDLHHAIQSGTIEATDVHAELGDIVAGKKAGRESQSEIIIFDSTGTALQDVAAAAIVYQRALEQKKGIYLDFQD
jgi:alanine dehydrogenase